MPNYYLIGYLGKQNAGDDAFVFINHWGLRKYGEAKDIFLDSGHSCYSSIGLELKQAFTAPKFLPGINRLRRIWYRYSTDCLVLAGGSLLKNNEQVKLLNQDNHWQTSERHMIAFSLSVGPFSSSQHETTTKEYLDKFSFIGFRDDFSYAWAKSNLLNARCVKAFDLAVLIPRLIPVQKVNKSEMTIGISIIEIFKDEDKNLKLVESIANVLNCMSDVYGLTIIVFALCTNKLHDDRHICRRLRDKIRYDNVEVFEHDGNAIRTFQKLASLDRMVSMRLHGAIFSYAAEIPFIVVGYERKCFDFARTIQLDEIFTQDAIHFDEEKFHEGVEKLLITEFPSAIDLPLMQQRAIRNFDIFSPC